MLLYDYRYYSALAQLELTRGLLHSLRILPLRELIFIRTRVSRAVTKYKAGLALLAALPVILLFGTPLQDS